MKSFVPVVGEDSMLEFRYIKKPYWKAFVLCLLLAALLFLPISLRDAMQGKVFYYAGDYNSQSLPFWQYANDFVKQAGSFSWATDIGSGFINSCFRVMRILADGFTSTF